MAARRYGLSLLLCLVLLLIKDHLDLIAPGHARIMILGPLIASFFWGIGPGIFALVFGILVNVFYFIPRNDPG
jgi:hypothetical protein